MLNTSSLSAAAGYEVDRGGGGGGWGLAAITELLEVVVA